MADSELVDPAEYDAETAAVLAQYTQRQVRVAVFATVLWVGLAAVLAFAAPGKGTESPSAGFLVVDVVLCAAVIGLTWIRVNLKRRRFELAIAEGRAQLAANGWRRFDDPS